MSALDKNLVLSETVTDLESAGIAELTKEELEQLVVDIQMANLFACEGDIEGLYFTHHLLEDVYGEKKRQMLEWPVDHPKALSSSLPLEFARCIDRKLQLRHALYRVLGRHFEKLD